MELRPATIDDTEAIRRVARRAWHAAYEGVLDEATVDATVAEWYADETLAEEVDRPGTAFLVAERDDGVVGFTHGVVQGDEGDVLRMYVDPDHWREGVGTALHERLRDDLLDLNMKRMRAIGLAANEIGRRFYEKLGFEQTGEGEVEIGDETYCEVVYTMEFEEGAAEPS